MCSDRGSIAKGFRIAGARVIEMSGSPQTES
jgi:hypothetical protein